GFWWIWFRDRPEDHRAVSPAERAHIAQGRGTRSGRGAAPLTVRRLAASANVWIAMGQYFASNFTFFFCLTWLFPYLQRTYRLEAVQAGLLSSAPLVAGAIGNWFGGWFVDALYRRGHWTRSRRVPAMLGFSIAAVGLIGCLMVAGPVAKALCLAVAVFG